MTLVSIEGVTKTYRQGEVEVQALRGIDMAIAEGEFTALVGPSGSGKTTLLNLIGGLDDVSAGRIAVGGQDLTAMGEGARSDYRLFHIGFVFQAYNLVPVLSALENVEFVMVLQGRSHAECRLRAMHYLERVGLADMAHRLPKALSGGQQQRVAVARALAAGPRLVLADEPTANLDSENALGLLHLMHELNHEEGMTFLFSTHDPRVMERAERIVTIQDGRISAIDDRGETLSR
ncbi:MAG TPA: ABC transporter ATP-binding protein [bacterium]|jgi:putative ABC transport system ATP-binding protein